MATIVGILAGRTWDVDSLDGTATGDKHKGVSSVTRTYLLQRTAQEVTWDYSDEKSYETLASQTNGLPKIGDKHGNNDPTLRVSRISYAEGEEGDKLFLKATVTYSRTSEEQPAQEQGGVDIYCEAWGWHNGSVARDLKDWSTAIGDEGATPPLNSAGDPFDSVPQVDWPAPTFTKVFKSKSRISGVVDYMAHTNEDEVTIGSVTAGPHQLRVVQADEDRIFNDPFGYRYRYTISLQWLSNVVQVFDPDAQGGVTTVDIGWDVAVADMGLRETTGTSDWEPGDSLKRITDDMDGEAVPVSTPVPLDGRGHRANDGKPVFLWFQAYPTADIPTIFYSEPD